MGAGVLRYTIQSSKPAALILPLFLVVLSHPYAKTHSITIREHILKIALQEPGWERECCGIQFNQVSQLPLFLPLLLVVLSNRRKNPFANIF